MPPLCSFIFTGDVKEGQLDDSRCEQIYTPVLHWARRRRWLTMSGAVGLFVLSVFIFSRLGAVFCTKTG